MFEMGSLSMGIVGILVCKDLQDPDPGRVVLLLQRNIGMTPGSCRTEAGASSLSMEIYAFKDAQTRNTIYVTSEHLMMIA